VALAAPDASSARGTGYPATTAEPLSGEEDLSD
jgi:hypothetical protein